MELSKKEIKWWKTKTNTELAEHYSVNPITVNRTKRKYGIKNVRKNGSGCNTTITGHHKKCKICENTFWVVPSRPKSTYCSRSCQYADEEWLDMLRNIDRSYMNTEEYSKATSKSDMDEYKRYRNKVSNLTEKTYRKYKHKINPDDLPRTKAGVENGYQLDHIIPVRFGFDNGIPPEMLSEQENLRMLTWQKNLERNRKDTTN